MTIKAGDRIPEGKLKVMGADGPANVDCGASCSARAGSCCSRFPARSRRPAARSTCRASSRRRGALRAKGVAKIVCLAVNDVFVMGAWGKSAGAGDAIVMAADGNGDYTRALGLELDARGFGMGMRGQRFALVIEDGVVKQVHVEAPGEFKVSSAEHILGSL